MSTEPSKKRGYHSPSPHKSFLLNQLTPRIEPLRVRNSTHVHQQYVAQFDSKMKRQA